jgi:hypothetical protein
VQEYCLVFTLLPGRGESARDFMRQLADGRRAEQERSERRVGIRGMRWFLAEPTAGETLVGILASPDLGRSLRLLAVSMDPHDLWFKRSFAACTGLDLNDGPEVMAAELLHSSRGELGGEAQPSAVPFSAGMLHPSELAAG